jgi:hypothetical protein
MVEVLDIDRIIVLTDDLNDSIEQFERLGLDFGDSLEMDIGGDTIVSRLDWSGVDLMTPGSEEGELAAYLDARGPGLYGLALRVSDLEEAMAKLDDDGIEPMDEYRSGDVSEALYHPRHFSGVLVILAEYVPEHPLEEAVE